MSSWGNRDNVQLTANVTVIAGSAVVSNASGNATIFLSEVKPGDYFIVGGRKYQVYSVNSNVLINLTDSIATSANTIAFVQQGPKYIANIALSDNTYTIQRVFGVDRDEKANVAGPASANANAVCHTGWVHIFEYSANGVSRIKGEVLVAMSKNFNANSTSNLHVFADASDNATFPQVRNAGGLPDGN